MSLEQGGNANLFVMDLRSKATTRLTDTPAIEGLCTRGTGLPFAWPALALTVAAVLSELAPRRG